MRGVIDNPGDLRINSWHTRLKSCYHRCKSPSFPVPLCECEKGAVAERVVVDYGTWSMRSEPRGSLFKAAVAAMVRGGKEVFGDFEIF